ncbi:hypothetical protein GCM10017786_28690 [Amycolatopsis deserti]|uniref:Uncharacterized protein n=1 Tax=Amycolatopsis deserti TaxID=185696 RepID=A0ABQ3IWT9_9PSEU|nr:hypothetical protein GCM10017786_28690 [Amycolatopsis deserti]
MVEEAALAHAGLASDRRDRHRVSAITYQHALGRVQHAIACGSGLIDHCVTSPIDSPTTVPDVRYSTVVSVHGGFSFDVIRCRGLRRALQINERLIGGTP